MSARSAGDTSDTSHGRSRLVEVAHFRVFQRGSDGGNPCPVVVRAAELSSPAMQRIAAHFGEESGFVCTSDPDAVQLRFFMPRQEVAMCVHATVAATTALVHRGELAPHGETEVRTGAGPCRVSWDDRASPRVTVEQQPPRFGEPRPVANAVERALRLRPGAVDAAQPVRSVSVATPKLLVPLGTAEDVHGSDPDFDLLWKMCEELETTGAYVFAPHPDGTAAHLVARQFPLGGGIREDAATGVAAGALAAYVADRATAATPRWTEIRIDQGDAMGCPCTLEAAAYAESRGVLRTTVTGSASLEREERLDVAAVDAQEP